MSLLGGDPWRDAVELHRRLAYVPGDVSLWPKLTGGETIDLFGRLRGDLDPARRDELVERFELDPTKRARTYSKGNRQKVALIAALASRAELLILDEPTSGLDPLMEEVFQHCIREVRDEGRTVLLSSHILAEVEALCDRVSIIRNGTTVEAGTLDSMRQLTRTSIHAETDRPPEALDRLEGVHGLTIDRDQVRFDVDTVHLAEAVQRLSDAGLRTLVSTPPTLEELFLRHYGDAPVPEIEDEASTRPPSGERPHRHAAAGPARRPTRPGAARCSGSPASSCWCSSPRAAPSACTPRRRRSTRRRPRPGTTRPRSPSTVPTSRSTRSAARSRSRSARWASPSSGS